MTERSVARFAASDIEYMAELIGHIYDTLKAAGAPETGLAILEDFIEALENDDSIEIVDDEEMLDHD